jgi:hypothetical protein
MDTEKAIFLFLRTHYAEFFPTLAQVHRTTFTRQAANLWYLKRSMWKAMLEKVEHDSAVCLVDSFSARVCSFAKAPLYKGFAGGGIAWLRCHE